MKGTWEKMYNEALERARKLKEMYPQDAPGYEEVFPELRESEDERIRKSLIEFVEQFTDGERKEKTLAWLERQKENPKSADSIPSDCVSDAKCEGRWHKVGDSLPDNPREVLCKDEAGNYFIGRYYVGEGWEISNYDDEDKPHHLNPPVSKWIDFPSEKQKEQKEIPLMNGDADLYFDEWNQQNQNPTKRQCFEEGIIYAQRLQKEQKPAEYLDKDKVYAIMTKLTNLSYSQLIPINSDEYKELGEIASDVRSLLDYSIEQKPAWSEEDKDKLSSIERLIVNANAHGNYLIGDKEAIELQHFIRSIVKPTTKPAWSEEDEEMLNLTKTQLRILQSHLSHTHSESMSDMEYSSKLLQIEKCVSWLDIRLKSLHPQPKQEWSEEDIKKIRSEEYTKGFNDCLLGKQKGWNEEDEKMLSKIIKHFDWYDSDRFNAEDCKEAQDFLKSLCPQAKKEWDTHDKAIVNCIVCCLDGQFVPEAARKQALEWFNKHRRDFLNSPSWKPREEQMRALKETIDFAPETFKPRCTLMTLHHDLEKLM